jgi:prepilin-type N-terminal cleavage/methylation domain-containing protein
MKKECGFTLIELILTLVLTALLASIVVEIIAGPIKSYFWINQQAVRVETAEQTIDMIAKELRQALPQTVKIENEDSARTLSFQKILYKGLVILPAGANNEYAIVGSFPEQIEIDKAYWLIFPLSSSEPMHAYKVNIKNEQSGMLTFNESIHQNSVQPVPFYLLSEPIHYTFSQQLHLLQRRQENDEALVANQVQNCQFQMFEENTNQGVLVSFSVGGPKEKLVKFNAPIMLEHIL